MLQDTICESNQHLENASVAPRQSLSKRGLFGLLTGGNGVGGLLSTIGGLITGKSNISSILAGTITDVVNGRGLLGGVVDSLARPAMFLVTGFGKGAITGLGMASTTK